MFGFLKWFTKSSKRPEPQKPSKPDYSKLLEKYQDKIDASMVPFIEIKTHTTKHLDLWQSKIAGLPYLPSGTDYPKTSQGKHLHLLAQINFDEVPNIEPYPKTGLLQFWIDDDDLYGLNLEDQITQDTFRVIYYPTVQKENLITEFDFVPPAKYSPIWDPKSHHSLTFKKSQMPVIMGDYRFGATFSDQEEEELFDIFDEIFSFVGHRIGGYGSFTQADPRESLPNFEHLLFQLDTDLDMEKQSGFLWGDTGVGNFFISEENLKARDFSKILYNWDCS